MAPGALRMSCHAEHRERVEEHDILENAKARLAKGNTGNNKQWETGLRSNGYYVLTDFGLSEAPGVATKSGTRGYWAPETIRQEPQTEAADWWSVGVMMAYAATGKHPFHANQPNHGSVDDRAQAAGGAAPAGIDAAAAAAAA